MITPVMLTATLWWAILAVVASARGSFALISSVAGSVLMAVGWGAVWVDAIGWIPTSPLEVWLWTGADTQLGAMYIVLFATAMQAGVTLLAMLLTPAKPIRDVSASAQLVALRIARWSAVPALVSFVAIYGTQSFLFRSAYQPEYAIGALATLVGPVILASAFFTSVLSVSSERRDRRLGLLLLVTLALLLAGTASRQLGLLAVVWFLAYLLSGRPHRVLIGVVSAIVAYLSLAFAISARGNRSTGHGLIPYLQALFADPVQFLSQSFWSPVLNVLSAAPITQLSASSDRVSAESFWISVNPFSSSEEWGAISSSLRVHAFIPFSAIGELFALGWAAALGTAFFIGALFAVFVRTVARTAGQVGLLVGGASVLYVGVLLLQYNLRSSMRMIELLAVVALVLLWTIAASLRKPKGEATNISQRVSMMRPAITSVE